MDSKAKARAQEAKEENVKKNATTTDQPGIFRETALNHTRAKARANDSKENATTAEKSDIQPASAPRAKEMRKEPGAKEDAKELEQRRIQRKRQRDLASRWR